jgi:phosphoribosylformylglycinamidine (FGAM) synthase-like amidotransferase family enzyme
MAFRYTTPRRDPPSQPQWVAEQHGGDHQQARNVLGMMPHPEQASERLMGSGDGSSSGD